MSRLAEIPFRRLRLWPLAGRRAALATMLMSLSALPALAQGKLDARYEVTLAGIPVGRGAWTIEIAEDHYSASVSGATVGLLKAISGGHGNGTAQGRVVNGQLAPINYTATSETSKKAETIRMALNGGNVTESSITPEPPEDAARIPVTDAHRHGVLDPMTGSMIRVPGTGDPVGPEACKSAAAIFDGRMRYDLRLEYKRMETVKAIVARRWSAESILPRCPAMCRIARPSNISPRRRRWKSGWCRSPAPASSFRSSCRSRRRSAMAC